MRVRCATLSCSRPDASDAEREGDRVGADAALCKKDARQTAAGRAPLPAQLGYRPNADWTRRAADWRVGGAKQASDGAAAAQTERTR